MFWQQLLTDVDRALQYKENKYCILMGDFNINLLNYESHKTTDEFVNGLGSFFFQRHSAILIDNIFFNSAVYFSGNILYDIY